MEFLRKNRMMITIVGAVLLVLVRMFSLLLGIDPINGYTRFAWVTVLTVVVGLVLAVLLIVPIVRLDPKRRALGDSLLFRIMSGVVAVAFLAETGVALVDLWNQLSGAMMMYQLEIPWVALLRVVLDILGVGFFFLLFRCGTQLPSDLCLILILGPIGLYIMRLIEMFMSITLNPSVDTYALMVLSTGLVLFFLSNLGRALLDGAITRVFSAGASLTALMLALSGIASPVLSIMQVPTYAGLIGWSAFLCDFSMLLFAVSTASFTADPAMATRRRHQMVGAAVPVRHRGRYIPKH